MNKNVSVAFKAILLCICFSFFQSEINAQTFDNGIFFQALARDNYANPAKDRKIYVQSTIIQSTINGTKVLVEEFQTATDASGVFGISIGKGTRTGGSFSSLNNIDWSAGPYFLNLQISITPVAPLESWNYAKDWIDLGTTSFGTVPYALHAKTVVGFDTKLNASDTAKMLLPYAKTQALKIVETAVATKLNTADTANMLSGYAKTQALKIVETAVATKLNAADTANMLSGYAKTQALKIVETAVATKLNAADTANMLSGYAKTQLVNTKLNTKDSITSYVTPTQLAAVKFDTTTLSNRIDLKANTSDMNSSLATKVDKVAYKDLSTNDYTTDEKTKLAAISGVNTGDQDLSVYATNARVDQISTNVTNSLALKAPLASPTFTGIVSGITKGMVGLGNVDNTSDAAKPVSSLTQTALNLKANLISPIFITPALGTPTSGVATNLTGLPLTTGVTGVLPVVNGGTGQQTFLNGQLLIGNSSGGTLTKANLTAGSGISITNGNGTITIASSALTGSGTLNYLPKYSGSSALVNSLIYDNGTSVGVGTNSPTGIFHVSKDASAVADQVEGVLNAGALTNVGLAWPGTEIWQAFTPGVSGSLSKISVFTFSGSSVVLKVYSGSGVGGTLLYTSSAENFIYGSKDFNITGVDVVAGNTYTFQLTASASFQIAGVYTKTKSGSATVNPGYGSLNGYTIGLSYATYVTGASKNLVFNGNLLIGNTIDDGSNMLQINGSAKSSGTLTAGAVTYPNAHGSNGQVLTTLGSGTLTWTTVSGGGGGSGVPYTGATGAVNLGAYDLTVNGLTIGTGAGTGTNTSYNTAVGYNSLVTNTTGIYNTGLGRGTLRYNTTGINNTATGVQALNYNISGSNNSAFGYQSLFTNTTGADNTAYGQLSMLYNTTGSYNTSIGTRSMINNIYGNANTAVGWNAGTFTGQGGTSSSSGGNNNTSLGYKALYANTLGSENTAVGFNALQANATGNQNTSIGSGADVASGALSNATAIGYGASVTTSNAIQLGNTSVTNVKTSGSITAGTVTYPNAHGTSGQVLSTTGSGTLTWTTPASSSNGAHAIGDVYGGGIVFFVWDGGMHGLIGANTELNGGNPVQWGGGNGTYVGTTSFDGILGGKLNTSRIMNVIPAPTGGSGSVSGYYSAAYYAATYFNNEVKVNGDLVTPSFSDWYLPNAYELILFANQKSYFPNCNFDSHDHWTSSERRDYAYLAYKGYALNGSSTLNITQDSKTNSYYVLAIRSF